MFDLTRVNQKLSEYSPKSLFIDVSHKSSLATRLCYNFTLLYIEACTYTR